MTDTSSTAPTSTSVDPERDRWFLGTHLRIVADGSDTAGQLGVMDQMAPRHFSPPLHVHHREDTAILLLDGELTIRIGSIESTLSAGGFVWLPRDVPHTFRVDSEQARLLEFVLPPQFIGFHVDTSVRAERAELPAQGPPDIPALLAAIGPYGAEILGPPMTAAD